MNCSKCGKQLEDDCLFCTDCGNKVDLTKKQSQLIEIILNNKTINQIKSLIDRFGDIRINKYLSIATIISMISIRFLGFIGITALITIINSILVYYNYRKNSEADMKMILWGISVLGVGILISI